MKTLITNIAAVGIIYRATNPTEIFLEMKDDGHPIKLVRRQLCPIGGNWIGDVAKNDASPLATFRRELNEELSFDRPMRNTEEYSLLGIADAKICAPTPSNEVEITAWDLQTLRQLKRMISSSARPFGDFLNTVSKSAMDATDPDNTRDGFTSLVSYYTIGLDENDWWRLSELQSKFGNLSNESITMMTSLDDIIRTETKTAFAHDRVLRQFWLNLELHKASQLPLVPGLESVPVGKPFNSYAEYLERYEVAKKPV